MVPTGPWFSPLALLRLRDRAVEEGGCTIGGGADPPSFSPQQSPTVLFAPATTVSKGVLGPAVNRDHLLVARGVTERSKKEGVRSGKRPRSLLSSRPPYCFHPPRPSRKGLDLPSTVTTCWLRGA